MLKMNHVKKNYPNFTLNCTLEVKPGYITGLIGQNGSGKTTAFKSALNLISTDGGTIEIFGKNLADIKPEDKENLGIVLSDSGFSGYLSIKDLVPILKNFYKKIQQRLFFKTMPAVCTAATKENQRIFHRDESKIKVIDCHFPWGFLFNIR